MMSIATHAHSFWQITDASHEFAFDWSASQSSRSSSVAAFQPGFDQGPAFAADRHAADLYLDPPVAPLTQEINGVELLQAFSAVKGTDTSGGTFSLTSVVSNYYAGSANGTSGYDIWVEFKGTGWTVALQDAFVKASDYFARVITTDIGGGARLNGKMIDDVYISAEIANIDGVGGILGQAGPTAVWNTTELTATAQMKFDVADAKNYLGMGLWDDIVTHEMLHSLGFGSLWNYGTNPLALNYQYTGAAGLAAYQASSPANASATYIPVETSGGSGTAGSHWSESVFDNELMTGYIDNNNYLSKFSVMSLADLGYKVGYVDYPYDGVTIA